MELGNTEELFVRDDAAGRDYPIWVALPNDYDKDAERRYPVLYVTDALYSFPLVRSIRNMVGQRGVNIEDFILVGLSPQSGLTSKQSRSRDYTPTQPAARGDSDDYSAEEYGGAAHYRDFLQAQVFPQVESRYRVDVSRRAFAGHSYGGLFGSYVLLTKPEMFQTYILSSPSLWFDGHAIDKVEADYATNHDDLRAHVLFSTGQYETQGPEPRYFKNGDMVGDNRRLAEKLKARRYPGLKVETSVLEGEDHFTIYPTVITRALLKVFPGKGPYSSG
ncbi:MAG: alpha/beta hydrolase-fold protein [Pseudoxanthomonas sp.]